MKGLSVCSRPKEVCGEIRNLVLSAFGLPNEWFVESRAALKTRRVGCRWAKFSRDVGVPLSGQSRESEAD